MEHTKQFVIFRLKFRVFEIVFLPVRMQPVFFFLFEPSGAEFTLESLDKVSRAVLGKVEKVHFLLCLVVGRDGETEAV